MYPLNNKQSSAQLFQAQGRQIKVRKNLRLANIKSNFATEISPAETVS